VEFDRIVAMAEFWFREAFRWNRKLGPRLRGDDEVIV
jgi:hypothetical protein